MGSTSDPEDKKILRTMMITVKGSSYAASVGTANFDILVTKGHISWVSGTKYIGIDNLPERGAGRLIVKVILDFMETCGVTYVDLQDKAEIHWHNEWWDDDKGVLMRLLRVFQGKEPISWYSTFGFEAKQKPFGEESIQTAVTKIQSANFYDLIRSKNSGGEGDKATVVGNIQIGIDKLSTVIDVVKGKIGTLPRDEAILKNTLKESLKKKEEEKTVLKDALKRLNKKGEKKLFSVKKEKTDLRMIMSIMYKADIDAYKDLVKFIMARIGVSKLKMFDKTVEYPMEMDLVGEESEESNVFFATEMPEVFLLLSAMVFCICTWVYWELYLVALLKRR